MTSRLNPNGRLAIDLNDNPAKFGARKYFDSETQDYFSSIGELREGNILITV